MGDGMQDVLWLYCSYNVLIPNQLTFLQPFRVLWFSEPIPGFTAGLSREKWLYTSSPVLEVSL